MAPTEKRLLEVLERLSDAQAQTLLDFAEFLAGRPAAAWPPAPAAPPEVVPVPAPENIERPREESVVRAIRRLRATYPMLNPAQLLGETSDLMSQHVMQGRDAIEVIDELETLFRTYYERLTRDK